VVCTHKLYSKKMFSEHERMKIKIFFLLTTGTYKSNKTRTHKTYRERVNRRSKFYNILRLKSARVKKDDDRQANNNGEKADDKTPTW